MMPHRRHRTYGWLALAATALLVLSGCVSGDAGQGATSGAAEPTLGAIAAITSPGQVTRPIDAFLPSAAQVAQLDAVQSAAVNACLTEHSITGGLDYDDPAQVQAFFDGLVSDRTARSDLWGFFDPGTAPQYGYGRPPQIPAVLQQRLPAGTPEDIMATCRHAGADALGGTDAASSYASASVLPDSGPPVPSTDSRYLAAATAWRQCMSERGFDYADPMAAIGDERWRAGNEADASQIATAVADVQCKVSTNLVGIGAAVQGAYDAQYVAAHRDQLDAFAATWDGYLRGGS